MSARRAAWLALALGLADRRADAAPMGAGVEAIGVLSLESDRDSDFAAKTLTNALRQVVLDAPEYTLRDENVSLLLTALELKCPLGGGGMLPDEGAFDEACLRKVSKALGLRRFFWGYVTAGAGGTRVRLHFWQQGQPERTATLPYEPAARDRLAERLYRKLVTPERVGDLAVAGSFEGELWVDGRSAGAFAPGAELTLTAGEHTIEVHKGPRVVARTRARVVVGERAGATLEAVAPGPPAPPSKFNEPPPVTIRPKASAWPWVLGGVGGAGLASAGTFFLLWRGAQNDLEDACSPGKNCRDHKADIDRSRLYSTLSLVSLGVGLGASVGFSFALRARRPTTTATTSASAAPRLWGSVQPVGGGAAAFVTGSF
jgi:hypothetical protein